MAGLTATIFVQLASMAGSVAGGWLADHFRKRTRRARMAVQAVGVLCGAPFVVLCGLTRSIGMLMFALTAWGFFNPTMVGASAERAFFEACRRPPRGAAWQAAADWQSRLAIGPMLESTPTGAT